MHKPEGHAQGSTAVCETVNVCPAIVGVPVRAPRRLAATMKFTVPFPVPLPGVTAVIHGTLLVAVHAPHPAGVAVTTMGVPAPPAEPNDWNAWSRVRVQVVVAACWVTVNGCP